MPLRMAANASAGEPLDQFGSLFPGGTAECENCHTPHHVDKLLLSVEVLLQITATSNAEQRSQDKVATILHWHIDGGRDGR